MTDDSDHPALVRCDAVARTFGSGRTAVVALHGATCEIWAGERIALMGPSGSGKSTLVHLLAGLEKPTSGTITWPALGDGSALRPGPIALVLQGPSLLTPLDVVENVALPLILAGVDEPEALSGGQMQRVAIARALVLPPRLLLADEPTGQLDHQTAKHAVDVLVEAAAEVGAALVVSTHDPAVGERLDHIWRVADGRLVTSPRSAACSA
jgi:ABC-type lipoprotein export system ATPase subunit